MQHAIMPELFWRKLFPITLQTIRLLQEGVSVCLACCECLRIPLRLVRNLLKSSIALLNCPGIVQRFVNLESQIFANKPVIDMAYDLPQNLEFQVSTILYPALKTKTTIVSAILERLK
eukprot:m.346703 g.346703  ORF g.346703 m.346703 type:complete len:118 (+) comp29894_c0_seq1:354-707(+)